MYKSTLGSPITSKDLYALLAKPYFHHGNTDLNRQDRFSVYLPHQVTVAAITPVPTGPVTALGYWPQVSPLHVLRAHSSSDPTFALGLPEGLPISSTQAHYYLLKPRSQWSYSLVTYVLSHADLPSTTGYWMDDAIPVQP